MRLQLLTLATLFCSTGCDFGKADTDDDEGWGDEADWDGSTEEPWDGGSDGGSATGGTTSDDGSTNGNGTTTDDGSADDSWAEDGGEEDGGEEDGGSDGSTDSGSCQFGSRICIETTADDPAAWCLAEAGTINDGACADGYTSSCYIPADGSETGTSADAATAYYYELSYAEDACTGSGGIFREESASDSDADGEAGGTDWSDEDDTGSYDTDTGTADDTGSHDTDTGTADDPDWIDGYCSGSHIFSETGTVVAGYTSYDYADDFYGGCDSDGGRDVAFRWSPPYSGTWRIDIPYSEFDPVLRIFRRYSGGGETDCGSEIECDRGYSYDEGSARITEYMYSYYDYYIVIDGNNSGDYGYFQLRIQTEEEAASTEDTDGDGFTVVEGDCNDSDATIHPGATENPYDSIDSDCDGESEYCRLADSYPAYLYIMYRFTGTGSGTASRTSAILHSSGSFETTTGYAGDWTLDCDEAEIVLQYDEGTIYRGSTTDGVDFAGTILTASDLPGTWFGSL